VSTATAIMASVATLEILHWNDVHGRWSGLARLSARARTIRESARHPVILLDAGDVEEGSVRLSALTKGVAGWRLLGAAGVDAAVVGNGGMLRYGIDVLPDYAKGLGSSPLVCDIELHGRPPRGTARSRLVRAGELTIGVIGATDYYPQYDIFGLSERGRVTAVRAEADLLRRHGAEVIVLLSHCSLNADRAISWALRGNVDLIVGGHSHDVLGEGDFTQGIPIVQAGCYGERLGRVAVDVSPAKEVSVLDVRHDEVGNDWPADQRVLDELEACERDLDTWLHEPVGKLEEPVDWSEIHDSDIARLTARALLATHPGDVGVLVAGHCTGGLPVGTVTRGDLWAATSSPGNAATATMAGAALRAMVRKGTSEAYVKTVPRTFRGRPYGALHLAGAELRGDELVVGDAPVQDDRRYQVTGSDLELSVYGLLVDVESDDLVVHAPAILPELLEDYLRERHPPGA
jgi:2',3'-cyclic-nucleotide 2'-phosphodiesterase (5'-nucleotidase family)